MSKFEDQWKPLLERDPRATEEFFSECFPKIRAYLNKHGCTDHQEAEDLILESFYEMMENAEKGECRFDSPPCGYLFGIVKNRWLETLREKKREQSAIDEITSLQDPDKDVHEEEEENEEEEGEKEKEEEEEKKKEEENWPQKDPLRKAFNQLSKACRDLLILFYYKEKSHKEIAEIRGTTSNYVKTHLARCRQYLRDRM